jgi:dTDP-4-dehydrorhamnose reductase
MCLDSIPPVRLPIEKTTKRAPAGPQGVYAQSKLGGERQAAGWQRHLIVRTCGLYGKHGPKTPGGNFVDTMLRIGRERGHVRVVDDQHCAPSYVPHVAGAVLFLLAVDARGAYHVVNTGATTWHGFASEVFRLARTNLTLERITTAQCGAPSPRPAYSLLDSSKYHALGGPAMPSWQNALAEYLTSRAWLTSLPDSTDQGRRAAEVHDS